MSFFYVDSNIGARVAGGGTTKQTGSMATLGAANIYASITLAIADGANVGDVICCSHLHAHDAGAATIIATCTISATAILGIMSVDDSNIDQYKFGAKEFNSGSTSADINFQGMQAHIGITWNSVDRFTLTGAGTQIDSYGSTYAILNAGNRITITHLGISFTLFDSIIDIGADTSTVVDCNNGAVFRMFGGAVTSSAGGDGLIDSFSTLSWWGGGEIELRGVDLSVFDGTLFTDFGATISTDSRAVITMDQCKLHSSVAFFNEAFATASHEANITRCSATSGSAEYQYFKRVRGADIEDDTAFYRDGAEAYVESGQKASIKITTDANVSPFQPISFDFPTVWAELSAASTDTIRVFLLSSSTLTDVDVFAVAVYPDGTNKHLGNIATSSASAVTGEAFPDPLASGTTLTTNTEAWTGRTTENRYQIDIDTSGNIGADCAPIIKLYVSTSSATIYACTSPEVVA